MADDRRERLDAAGRWLKRERFARGYETAGALARALGVDPSRISQYERGMSAVPDERAAQIAQLFGLSEIEVRRQLGLWVPEPDDDEDEDLQEGERPEDYEPIVVTRPDGKEQRFAILRSELAKMSSEDRQLLAQQLIATIMDLERRYPDA